MVDLQGVAGMWGHALLSFFLKGKTRNKIHKFDKFQASAKLPFVKPELFKMDGLFCK